MCPPSARPKLAVHKIFLTDWHFIWKYPWWRTYTKTTPVVLSVLSERFSSRVNILLLICSSVTSILYPQKGLFLSLFQLLFKCLTAISMPLKFHLLAQDIFWLLCCYGKKKRAFYPLSLSSTSIINWSCPYLGICNNLLPFICSFLPSLSWALCWLSWITVGKMGSPSMEITIIWLDRTTSTLF